MYAAVELQVGDLLQEELFHGVIMMRSTTFFGPAELQFSVLGHSSRNGQLWDSVWYEYDATWSTANAYTIGLIFFL